MMANVSLAVNADLANLSQIRNFIEKSAKVAGLYDEGISEIRLAVDEACANIIQHGYKDSGGEIYIAVESDGDKIIVSVSDNAQPYNPLEETPAPDIAAPLSERPMGGMGVMLVKQNADVVEYKATESGGNELIITKYLQKIKNT